MAKFLLTDAKIRGLKAESGKQIEHGDSLVPGLRIRVSGKARTWVLRQRAGGKVRTITMAPFGDGDGDLGVAAARTKAVAIQGNIAKGKMPVPTAPAARGKGTPTVHAAIDRFMAEYCPDKGVKRPDAYRWQFDKYVLPHFGDWRIAAVGKQDLRDFVRQVRDEHGLTTSRRVGGLLKRFFRFAAIEDLIEADPMSLVELPGKEVTRERTLSDAEIRALWLATDPASRIEERNRAGRLKPHPSMFPWGPYFRLLLLLGQRRGEVATMRWASIDLKQRTWTLEAEETKSARATMVPLSAAAVKLLKSLPRLSYTDEDGKTLPSPYVLTTRGRAPIADFSKPKSWLDEEMERLLGADGAALPAWRIHDVRRTVSTQLAKLGTDPFIRRRILNHALEGVDKVYDVYDYLEPKRRALDLWAIKLDRIVRGDDPTTNVVRLRRA